MKSEERTEKIAAINAELDEIAAVIRDCRREIEAIADQFREDRADRLKDAQRRLNKPQFTQLRLSTGVRKGSHFGIPYAHWRGVASRGGKVARSIRTLSRKGDNGYSPKDARNSEFSDFIPKNRNDGWRIPDLKTYAHPAELDLVEEAELKFRKIRIQLASLTERAMSLEQSRRLHERYLASSPAKAGAPTKSRKKKVPGWPRLEGQMEMELPERQDEQKEPAQYRVPTV